MVVATHSPRQSWRSHRLSGRRKSSVCLQSGLCGGAHWVLKVLHTKAADVHRIIAWEFCLDWRDAQRCPALLFDCTVLDFDRWRWAGESACGHQRQLEWSLAFCFSIGLQTRLGWGLRGSEHWELKCRAAHLDELLLTWIFLSQRFSDWKHGLEMGWIWQQALDSPPRSAGGSHSLGLGRRDWHWQRFLIDLDFLVAGQPQAVHKSESRFARWTLIAMKDCYEELGLGSRPNAASSTAWCAQ